MRLIDGDKLLEIYKKWIPQLLSKEDEGDRRGVETCIMVLEDAPTVDAVPVVDFMMANGVTVQEWISVDDRLPDETGRYLAVKKRIAPDELGGNRTDIVILRFFVDDGFRMPTHIPDWINGEINEEVTHWMPLPELPKGE